MRVTRVIVYEGSFEALGKQLSRSLPTGTKEGWGGGVTITVFTLMDWRYRWKFKLQQLWRIWRQM